MSEEKKSRCFVIMPISDQPGYPEGHFTKVYTQIFKVAIKDAGYDPYRVDEDNICDSIILKIFDGIQNCDLAICDLSSRNPNVLYELGLRQAYDKPVVLVQDEKTERIFDVGGINTIPYNSNRLYESVIEARERITQALKDAKNGKGYSLVKIVKSNAANFPEGELPENEKIQIMLQRIMFELNQIREEKKCDDKISGESIIYEKLNRTSNVWLIQKYDESIKKLSYEIDILLNDSSVINESVIKDLHRKIVSYESEISNLHINTSKKVELLDNLKEVRRELLLFEQNN